MRCAPGGRIAGVFASRAECSQASAIGAWIVAHTRCGLRARPERMRCAPAKGWEKGSVEGGVEFVRQNCFMPMPDVESFEALNELIRRELEADMERRRLADGRTVLEALAADREHLRPLPAVMPEACRTTSRVVDKFAQSQRKTSMWYTRRITGSPRSQAPVTTQLEEIQSFPSTHQS